MVFWCGALLGIGVVVGSLGFYGLAGAWLGLYLYGFDDVLVWTMGFDYRLGRWLGICRYMVG